MGVACSKQDPTIDGNNPHHHNYHYQQQLQNGQGSSSSSSPWSGCMSACGGIDPAVDPRMDSCRADAIDPVMYDLCRKSLNMTLQDEQNNKTKDQETAPPPQPPAGSSHHSSSSSNSKSKQRQKLAQNYVGQYHLLYKHQTKTSSSSSLAAAAAAAANNNSSNNNNPNNVSSSVSASAANAAAAAAAAAAAQESAAAEDAGVGNGGGMDDISTVPTTSPYSTRLIVRRRPIAAAEEGTHGTHLYAIRYPPDDVVPTNKVMAGSNSDTTRLQEQAPRNNNNNSSSSGGSSSHHHHHKRNRRSSGMNDPAAEPIPEPPRPSPTASSSQSAPLPTEGLTDFFQPAKMKQTKASKQTIKEWVTVSEEHCIYVVDVGLTPKQCDKIVQVTEQVCRGQYAAYTYAKQTLGCREFPVLAQACAPPVQSVVQAILGLPNGNGSGSSNKRGSSNKDQPQQHLQLDDREPHLVKYDVTKKERQKLDMHTDKSEWTFLIALSNGCGLDYDGGGTYFECLNATIHVQRGHALIFPGKLRHCGQRITRGLRYLLVGFLVDKAHLVPATTTTATTAASATSLTTTSGGGGGSITHGKTGKSSSSGDADDDHNNGKNSTGGSSGTKPVSARTLTGMPTTIASA